MDTIKVSWTTHIEEFHEAEIPADEWQKMLDAETFADDLAQYEGDPHGVAVTDREVDEVGEVTA